MAHPALFGRRELTAHRVFVIGVTASVPMYVLVDATHKEWVVDVYLGPLAILGPTATNVIKNCPIAPYAKQLVSDVNQPVACERSKHGQYTVIGRAKVMPAGSVITGTSIDDPTYREVQHNYSDLRLLWIADLDYVFEVLDDDPGNEELQETPDDALQDVQAFDAFGNQVMGEGAVAPPAALAPVASSITTAKGVKIQPAKLGPKGDPLAMDWGVSVLQPWFQTVVTFP